MKNYYKDPIKKQNALLKRFKTNMEKYNCKVGMTVQKLSNCIKRSHILEKSVVENVELKMTKNDAAVLLNSDQYHYTKFMGKGKYRTMIKVNPELFKAVMVYTKEFENFYNKKGKIKFTYRLLLAGKYKFQPPKNIFCRCGRFLCFEAQKQLFLTNTFCRSPECIMSGNSVEFYRYKYGEEWEKYYSAKKEKENTPEKVQIRKKNGRLNFQKRIEKNPDKKHIFVNIGKNEKAILDRIENEIGYKIDRNFLIEGYYPDGYCHETNTIYEVYENYHKNKKQIEYDKEREKIIRNSLKCNFVVIWDTKNEK